MGLMAEVDKSLDALAASASESASEAPQGER
jgi:hypothetical protein